MARVIGAWPWYKVVALMRSSGHNVTAIDLGASGINPEQVLEVPRLSDYLSPLTQFMASRPTHEKSGSCRPQLWWIREF